MSDPNHTEAAPSLDDLLEKAARDALEAHHGSLPVKVVKYTPADQTVDVLPLIRVAVGNELHELKTMRTVPVLWMATNTHSVTLPLAPNDLGWVVPAGGDISQWHAHGTERAAGGELRRFDLSDVVFVPGSRPLTNPLASTAYHASWAVLAGQWMIGSSAAGLAVALDADAVNKHSVPGLGFAEWMISVEAVAQAGGGVVSPAAATITQIGSVLASSTKLKSE